MKLLLAVVLTGIVLNFTGWAGNVFLLGPMWNDAVKLAPPPLASPFPPLPHVLLQFLSDFIFAFVLCWVYRLAVKGWAGSRLILAFACSGIVWLGGVPMCYLGLVNGGYLPGSISILTTALALVTFMIVAPLLRLILHASS